VAGDFDVQGGTGARPGEPMVYVATPQPGFLRRAGAGAWHVFGGFWYLVRHPDLWPLAALPTVLAGLFVIGGLALGTYSMRFLETALLPAPGRLSAGLSVVLMLALWIGALGAGVLLGLGLALLVAAPILERISRRVEAQVRVTVPRGGTTWRWELAQSFKSALYLMVAAPLLLLLSIIPIVGPVLGLSWGAHSVAMQMSELPLARRGLDFRARWRWHRRFLAESLGFGAAALVVLLVPCANFLLAPALMVGGTLMVLELEEDLVPPDRKTTPPNRARLAVEQQRDRERRQ
jgi:uncharacterized protein involved in cysteine biosynthesis